MDNLIRSYCLLLLYNISESILLFVLCPYILRSEDGIENKSSKKCAYDVSTTLKFNTSNTIWI